MEFDRFEWDEGNRTKCQKHGLSVAEIEGVFLGPVDVFPDAAHSQHEPRLRAFGRTAEGRPVLIAFTFRHHGGTVRLRPISARYMHLREVKAYEKANPDLQ